MKEVSSYEREVIENEKKLEEMKTDSSKDEHDIKYFKQVLAESYMMVPDSKKRLDHAFLELSDFLREYGNEISDDSEWYSISRTILQSNVREYTTNNTVSTNVDNLADTEIF